MERTILHIVLPKPPALNNLYGSNRNGKRYIKNKGRVWKEECILTIRSLGLDQWTDKCSLIVNLYTCQHQDADSILKLLMDSLEASEVIKDDYQIFELRVIKHKCKKTEEHVNILLEKLDVKS